MKRQVCLGIRYFERDSDGSILLTFRWGVGLLVLPVRAWAVHFFRTLLLKFLLQCSCVAHAHATVVVVGLPVEPLAGSTAVPVFTALLFTVYGGGGGGGAGHVLVFSAPPCLTSLPPPICRVLLYVERDNIFRAYF